VCYLLFFYLIVELFSQCGIYCFSIWLWNCSDSVVFIVFLFDCGTVQTVWYLLFFYLIVELFRQCGIYCFSIVFYLIVELFRQCGIYCFSIWLWNCSDSIVSIVFNFIITIATYQFLNFLNAPFLQRKTTTNTTTTTTITIGTIIFNVRLSTSIDTNVMKIKIKHS
jgi:hypothetical protein